MSAHFQMSPLHYATDLSFLDLPRLEHDILRLSDQ